MPEKGLFDTERLDLRRAVHILRPQSYELI